MMGIWTRMYILCSYYFSFPAMYVQSMSFLVVVFPNMMS